MNAIRLKQIFSASAACVLLSLATSALAQYVWLDEKGVKQFSDMPPPSSVPNKRILKMPGNAMPPQSAAPADADANADGDKKPEVKAPPTIAEQNAAFQKRKADQAEKDKKAAEEAKRASDKATNCAHARENQRTLNSGTRIAQTDANGQRSFMNDNQRAQQAAENQRTLNECQ
ncbi:DUF4124 domain-containing protein [Paraherbaspirillum soli]|uniref:DUF4124 domain-containing protein n=1 Tax=Paraherbaspirillum soli TaxID=631222 RepID=A0ABW0MC93_9BURK